MSYVAVDLETTGLDPGRDRVIEVGAVAFTEQEVKGRLSALADPGRTVPDQVQRLTGIDPRSLRGQPPPEVVLDRLAGFMRGGRPVGHGIRLEVGFLSAAGHPELIEGMLDTLDLARILLPRAASHSLPELSRELGLTQPSAHRAFDDADATRQLLLRLLERARALPPRLLERMQRLCEPYPWRVARFFGEEVGSPYGVSRDGPVPAVAAPVEKPRRSPPEDPEQLVGLLGPEGPLARAVPDFEYREGQVQMLLAVAQAMWRGRRLVVEAGTGTGKSLAYLIPAAARSVARGERVVIATHTHTLQEQLLLKDLPALRAWLPWDVEVALLKGRANYLSLRRWRRYLAQPCDDAEELCFKLRLLVWLDGTATGDRAELRLSGRDTAFWQRVASDPLDCVGIRCTPEDCFVHRARAQAEKADLVIVNHALLLADAQLEGGLIPEYQHLVVDEAHHLEQAATDGLRRDVDRSALIGLLDRLATVSEDGSRRRGLLSDLLAAPRLGESIKDLTDAEELALRSRSRVAVWFTGLGDWVRARNDGEGPREEAVRLVAQVREEPGMEQVVAQAQDAATALAALEAALRRVTGAGPSVSGGGPDQALREIEIVRGAVAEAVGLLDRAFRQPDPNTVYWVQQSARADWPSLRSAPLGVASLLHDQVFGGLTSAVATSASLALAGDFRYFMHRTGIGEEAETMVVASPFDYLRQALLCLPVDMPPPDDERFEEMLPDIVADLARRAGGGTLVLFTSHHQLRAVSEALHQRADLDHVRILAQGVDGPRRQVLQTFAEAGRGLLLGTASFWEGIDLPGDRLRCVVVVRLPFPVPTEPVYAARAELLRDPFRQLALPQATLRLKQGFGRLIRRREDRGAVVILDPRVVSRDYGRAFLEALPEARRLQAPLDEVAPRMEAWLAG